MNNPQFRRITLDSGLVALEYCLDPKFDAVPDIRMPAERQKDLERLASIYPGEELIEIAGVKYPYVFVKRCSLEQVTASAVPERYVLPEHLKLFADGVIEERRKKGAVDGSCVGLAGWKVNDKGIDLYIRETGYFDFIATNLSVDVPLSRFDDRFKERETLRKYEVVGGRSIEPERSTLANILGAAFIVSACDEGGKEYFLLGMRRDGLAVSGGDIGVPGGTPKWGTLFNDPKFSFSDYLVSHIREELEEELLLKPEELDIRGCSFLKCFTRAPELQFDVRVKNTSIESIVARSCGNQSALEEHSHLYAFPKDNDALLSVLNTGKMRLGTTTIVGMYLCMNNTN